ncbi:hypothetical protein N9N36_01885, partial [Gammaproteobacteria bacterium]|nr:hypothetical protein [Gammaproteobacteria bacterium]
MAKFIKSKFRVLWGTIFSFFAGMFATNLSADTTSDEGTNVNSASPVKNAEGEVLTGSFVQGTLYEITEVGDTDFTLIGASSNEIGEQFTASDIGGGSTGKAKKIEDNGLIFLNNEDLSPGAIAAAVAAAAALLDRTSSAPIPTT